MMGKYPDLKVVGDEEFNKEFEGLSSKIKKRTRQYERIFKIPNDVANSRAKMDVIAGYYIEIESKQLVDGESYINLVGDVVDSHETEKKFVGWLLENKHVLEEVIGLVPNEQASPAVNATFFGTNLRPDIVYRTDEPCLYIIEAKNTKAKYPSQSMSFQVAAIGQLLLYRALCGDKRSKLFLVDNCIHKETVAVVQQNNLPIGLIQACSDRWIVRYCN